MNFIANIRANLFRKKVKKSMKISLETMHEYVLFLEEELSENKTLTFEEIQQIQKSKESVNGAIQIMILVGNFYGVNFYMEKSNGEFYVDWDKEFQINEHKE
jgi:hypothetical protein